jgi:carboxyl-terminal processing protease
MSQHPSGMVLDLRSNPGGFVTSAIEISSQFMSDGVIFYQRSAGADDQEFRPTAGGLATSVPMVVLINRGSASASEITAAALRDAGRAVLMGEKSYGKGTVQTVRQLSDQSGLRLTSAQWLTPGKVPIHGVGLQPDVALEGALAPGTDIDAAVSDAAQYLLSHVAAGTAAAITP